MRKKLGERLEQAIERCTQMSSKKEVAIEWAERLRHETGEQWRRVNYPVEQLSRLLSGSDAGIRFFFKDDLRARLLLDVLELPRSEQADLQSLAHQILDGSTPPRLLIDVTAWTQNTREMFLAVEQLLVCPGGLRPIVVVMLEEQYNALPRSFDDFEACTYLRVPSPAEAAARIRELADETSLVASREPLVEVENWLAFDIEHGEFRVEPSDGLAHFADHGALPAPPTAVDHNLETLLGETELPEVDLPRSATARRRLMLSLSAVRFEAPETPEDRAALGRALGVPVQATVKERLQLGLDVTIQAGTAQKLEALLRRARLQKLNTQILEIGGQLHVINADIRDASLEDNRVTFHTVESVPPAIRLLRERLPPMNTVFCDDRLHHDIIETLVNEGNDRRLLHHALACLQWSNEIKRVEPKPVKQVQDALAAILNNPVPEALVRVDVSSDESVRWVLLGPEQERRDQAIADAFPDLCKKGREIISRAPLLEPADLARENAAYLVTTPISFGRKHRYQATTRGVLLSPSSSSRPRIEIPFSWGQRLSEEEWQSSALEPREWDNGDEFRSTGTSRELNLAPDLWSEADATLAEVWFALRSALSANRWIQVADNSLVLGVAPGLAAQVHVTRGGSWEGTRGAVAGGFVTRTAHDDRPIELIAIAQSSVVTSRVNSYSASISVPHRLWLGFDGLQAEVRFRSSWMMGGGSAGAPTETTTVAQLLADEDDDDDTDW